MPLRASSLNAYKSHHRSGLNCGWGSEDWGWSWCFEINSRSVNFIKSSEIPSFSNDGKRSRSICVFATHSTKHACYVGPNITGFVANIAGDLGGTGPFINQQNAGTGWGPEDNRGNTRQFFNARAAHYIYGASDTVQPRSLQFLPCIKFWCLVLTGSKQAEP